MDYEGWTVLAGVDRYWPALNTARLFAGNGRSPSTFRDADYAAKWIGSVNTAASIANTAGLAFPLVHNLAHKALN